MTCPTCDHMMYKIDSDACPWMFWCPGCGTLKSELLGNGKVHTPKLVERCRRFESFHFAHMSPVWFEEGIHESIRLPDDRRTQ